MNDNGEIRELPGIGRRVTRVVLSFGVLAAIAMGLFFYSGSRGYDEVSNWLLIAFFVLVPVGLITGFVILNNVRCPACGGSTSTIRNREADMWQARCSTCHVTWNLGVGIDTDP